MTRAARNIEAYSVEALDRSGALRVPSEGNLLLRLWPFLEPHRAWLWVAIATSLVSSLLSLARPLIMLRAIDAAVAAKDSSLILRGGILFACVSLIEQGLNFVQVYATQIVGARAMADLRFHLFRFIGRLPQRFFDRQPVGRIVTRVTSDVDSLQELFSSGIVSALGSGLRIVGVVALMFLLDVELTGVALLSVPLIGLVVLLVRRRARDAYRAIRGETARMNSNMNEQVSGLAVVQAHGQERGMFQQFDQINGAYRDANVRSIKYEAIQDAGVDAISSIALALVVVALGYHHATFGTVVALSSYLSMFFEPISALAQLYTLVQNALSGAERVFSLLDEPERDMSGPLASAPAAETAAATTAAATTAAAETPAAETTVEASEASEAATAATPGLVIEFRDVTFGYRPGLVALEHVDLRVQPGQVVALVGPTGSGKTTITALLLRLYELWSGRIFVHGKDIQTLSPRELRAKFAVVPQDVVLFPGTLAENIALGQVPDLDRVQSVLAEMGVADLFQERAGGLLAEVRAGGANFSAGERQLIAFARALYKRADILILDEATASVDSDTEARMQRALSVLMRGRTSIVVAHRLSTIRAADSIVVLAKGHIVEQGTHEQLLRQRGLYAALHDLQLSRAPSRPPLTRLNP